MKGLFDEYKFLLAAADGDRARLDSVLAGSEQIIREKFRRK